MDTPGSRRACDTDIYAPDIEFRHKVVNSKTKDLNEIWLKPPGSGFGYVLKRGENIGSGSFGAVTRYSYTDLDGKLAEFALKKSLYYEENQWREAIRALNVVKNDLQACNVAWFAMDTNAQIDGFPVIYTLMERLTSVDNIGKLKLEPGPALAVFETFATFLQTVLGCLGSNGATFADMKPGNIGFKICGSPPELQFRLIDLDGLNSEIATFGIATNITFTMREHFTIPDKHEFYFFLNSLGEARRKTIETEVASATTLVVVADSLFRSHPKYGDLKKVYTTSARALNPATSLVERHLVSWQPFSYESFRNELAKATTEAELFTIAHDILDDIRLRYGIFRAWLAANGGISGAVESIVANGIEKVNQYQQAVDEFGKTRGILVVRQAVYSNVSGTVSNAPGPGKRAATTPRQNAAKQIRTFSSPENTP